MLTGRGGRTSIHVVLSGGKYSGALKVVDDSVVISGGGGVGLDSSSIILRLGSGVVVDGVVDVVVDGVVLVVVEGVVLVVVNGVVLVVVDGVVLVVVVLVVVDGVVVVVVEVVMEGVVVVVVDGVVLVVVDGVVVGMSSSGGTSIAIAGATIGRRVGVGNSSKISSSLSSGSGGTFEAIAGKY
jgi:hypothetical protein